MKNISLIINIVLAVALGVVLVLHFSLSKRVSELESQPIALKAGGSSVVYINMDSLYKEYNEYVDLKTNMEEKQSKMSQELNSKKISLERSAADFQDKMQKGLLLRSEAEKIQQQLMQQEQSLMKLNESMQMQLAEETQVLNRRLYNNIVEFLRDYNKGGKFNYVLSHSFGGPFLYVNDSLDITKEVIKGLNAKYTKPEKE
jgi:outer membrane protein